MDEVKVNLDEQAYPIIIGNGILVESGFRIREFVNGSQLLLVSDLNVYEHYGEVVKKSLQDAGFEVFAAPMEPGEENKNLSTVESLYEKSLDAGLDRHSAIVALGGGVVGDIAGFVAATYLRGVPFIQLPTTLLAQVDSSVGGKVGVNHRRGKNLIGAFYQPRLVIIDIETLTSLPQSEFKAGLGEVVKYGLLGDKGFWNWLEENIPFLLRGEGDSIFYAVKASVENKARVVELDEREEDTRRVLNLGHTFAHGLEAATGYSYYLHGEAVLIGINMATLLAEKLDLIDAFQVERIRNVLEQIGFKPPPEWLSVDEVLARLVYDKKREGKSDVFILPNYNGNAVVYYDPPPQLIREVVENYLCYNSN